MILNNLIINYTKFTKNVMSRMAINKKLNWPVKYNHYYQRIVLDNICNGCWYNLRKRPAYKHLKK